MQAYLVTLLQPQDMKETNLNWTGYHTASIMLDKAFTKLGFPLFINL